jgi:hypothetical protein
MGSEPVLQGGHFIAEQRKDSAAAIEHNYPVIPQT